jgi:hypothetical protein
MSAAAHHGAAMFSLTELHIVHGVAVVDDDGFIDFPIEQVGFLLDWKLEKVFQSDILIFNKGPIKLFPSGGNLHIRVTGAAGSEFSWNAERHILHIWPKEPVT